MKNPYFNRELSWIEFNSRVLSEAQNPDVPLLERLKFLSITSSNFDEFFMVRVASLVRQYHNNSPGSCPTGMTPREQLDAIHKRVHQVTDQKYELLLDDLIPALKNEGIVRVRPDQWNDEQEAFAKHYFREQVFPILTPVRVNVEDQLPYLGNLRMHGAFLLYPTPEAGAQNPIDLGRDLETATHLAIVQIPTSLDRVVPLPSTGDQIEFTFLEQFVQHFSYQLFPGYEVTEKCLFRVTRDADFGVDEARDEDFVEAMEEVLETRQLSEPVRLSINTSSDKLRELLTSLLGLPESAVYQTPDPLELSSLMDIYAFKGFDHLRDERWKSYSSPKIEEDEPVWESIRRRDILLYHPYESFDSVVRFVSEAANDPDVLAIKMTLYRTSGDSPIIKALETAAQNGIHVSVLVELKARFDEERNIEWAQRLQRAGVIVVYGIARLKVHAKALLVIRRERDAIRRYAHLGTGNYNDKTAKLYTDMGLFTSREDLTYEISLFFNAITGYSVIPGLSSLVIAPIGLKNRLLELIEREALRADATGSGFIMAKFNALADPEVIRALYDASRRGVNVRLNIRGICMLVPGVKDLSENIEVISVVDRYLEHTRAFYFENGGAEEVYLSSADWMPRNLEKRVELMFPVKDRELARRVKSAIELFFQDNQKAHRLLSDGSWERVAIKEKAVRAQAEQRKRTQERVKIEQPENRQEFKVRKR